jgi:hypothetical protein
MNSLSSQLVIKLIKYVLWLKVNASRRRFHVFNSLICTQKTCDVRIVPGIRNRVEG